MSHPLSHYFSVSRRYARSINPERDLKRADALDGYLLTDRSRLSLERILAGVGSAEGCRAWTLTSVYGTGKSAFAHFLLSLFAPENSELRRKAIAIIRDEPEREKWGDMLPNAGFVRAVATARREPIAHTVLRALKNGAESFFPKSKRLDFMTELVDIVVEIETGESVDNLRVVERVLQVAKTAETGVFLVIDELGKNLEYAVYNDGAEDLYLLQQLAELQSAGKFPICILGILHQSFADYGERLATVQRNEWAKIQGRFEDIPFADSTPQMLRLIGGAIASKNKEKIACPLSNYVDEWMVHLGDILPEANRELFEGVYPLHPVTALVLPTLCGRYAQNDRSLFTFLTSREPHSFSSFLDWAKTDGEILPTLKLDRLYDYFIESVGMGMVSSRVNQTKWVEIQGVVNDAKNLDGETIQLLKAIGILNLVTMTGSLRANRELVTLALCDFPDYEQRNRWGEIIDRLLQKGLITDWKVRDELRIWQGSDFNIDAEVNRLREQNRTPLAKLLAGLYPLKHLVAQRHSYQTGTLRYFERRYLDDEGELKNLSCDRNCDGTIAYWVNHRTPDEIPERTGEGKPLIVLAASRLETLRIQVLEYAALAQICNTVRQLQTDAVARREIRHRLTGIKQLLDESFGRAFEFAGGESACWVMGKREEISSLAELNRRLSEACDRVYFDTPILWNELVNRRELTSQASAARRMLIEAMLTNEKQERLGLTGNGPEVSLYYSILETTGIHRRFEDSWGFYPPDENSGLRSAWEAIADFCRFPGEKPRGIDELYRELADPNRGIGMKPGAVPVLLAAVLLHHRDRVGVYCEGTFVPFLGPEHFELLVKVPERFAVKGFELAGGRSRVFEVLETLLKSPKAKAPEGARNARFLLVVKPLFQFAKKLPHYTQKTRRLSSEGRAVLDVLQGAKEPDRLLFESLPEACGVSAFGADEEADDGDIGRFKQKLNRALSEIDGAYDRLLEDCRRLLNGAFGIRAPERLREDLRERSRRLAESAAAGGLRSFILAAADGERGDREWLEAVAMIVADKPPESWTDETLTRFEMRLADLARRFRNLEALQSAEHNGKPAGEPLQAMRLTLTQTDGEEMHRVVWVDRDREDEIEEVVERILQQLPKDAKLRQAAIARLTERILG